MPKSELVELPPETSPVLQVVQAIERMVLNPEVDADKMERLLTAQMLVMDRVAKGSFARDMALMQAEIPSVKKRGKSNNNTYATFDDLMDAVRMPAAKYGFSVSFVPDSSDGKNMTVTATITHHEGHEIKSVSTLPFDNSGSKNAVQAIGSAQKYGMRYALVGLLAISTHDNEDTDGEGLHHRVTETDARLLQEKASGYGLAHDRIFTYYSKVYKFPITTWEDFPSGSTEMVLAEIEKQGVAKATKMAKK